MSLSIAASDTTNVVLVAAATSVITTVLVLAAKAWATRRRRRRYHYATDRYTAGLQSVDSYNEFADTRMFVTAPAAWPGDPSTPARPPQPNSPVPPPTTVRPPNPARDLAKTRRALPAPPAMRSPHPVSEAPTTLQPPMLLAAVRGPHLDRIVDRAITFGSTDEDTISLQHMGSERVSIVPTHEGWRLYATSGADVRVDSVPVDESTLLEPGSVIEIGKHTSLRVRFEKTEPDYNALKVVGAAASRLGDRVNNEDAHLVTDDLIALADGAGGRPDGASASQLATQVLRNLPAGTANAAAIKAINSTLRELNVDREPNHAMATTLDIVHLVGDGPDQRVEGAHIGDNSVFVDDGVAIRVPTGSPETTGGVLATAVGLEDAVPVRTWTETATAGDRYVLLSDGVRHALGAQDLALIGRVLTDYRGASAESTVEALLDAAVSAASARGAHMDNMTAVVADLLPGASAGSLTELPVRHGASARAASSGRPQSPLVHR